MSTPGITVKHLVEKLRMLPPEATVWLMTYQGVYPLVPSDFSPFQVYEKNGETRLCIDDGEAYHEIEKHTRPLFPIEEYRADA